MNFIKNTNININFSFKIMNSVYKNKNRDRFLAFLKGVME